MFSKNQPYVGADIEEIVGAVVDSLVGAGDIDAQLASILSGDPTVGLDEIIGAALAKKTASGGGLEKLAALRAAGQRGVVSKQNSELKWELLPIPVTTLLAGQTLTVDVAPIRAQRLDQIEFPSSLVDHGHIALTDINIGGTSQMNGSGGVLLSQLSEVRANNILRGSTAQRNEPIKLTFQNMDTVNARTLRGTIGGPTIR
jgi:hypothetical protein